MWAAQPCPSLAGCACHPIAGARAGGGSAATRLCAWLLGRWLLRRAILLLLCIAAVGKRLWRSCPIGLRSLPLRASQLVGLRLIERHLLRWRCGNRLLLGLLLLCRLRRCLLSWGLCLCRLLSCRMRLLCRLQGWLHWLRCGSLCLMPSRLRQLRCGLCLLLQGCSCSRDSCRGQLLGGGSPRCIWQRQAAGADGRQLLVHRRHIIGSHLL